MKPFNMNNLQIRSGWFLILGLLCLFRCAPNRPWNVVEESEKLRIAHSNYTLNITKEGFKIEFLTSDGSIIAPAHHESGLQFGRHSGGLQHVSSTTLVHHDDESVTLEVQNEEKDLAQVRIVLDDHHIKFGVHPAVKESYDFLLRTGGMGPAYGMADHAAIGTGGHNLVLEEFVADPTAGDNGRQRMISNFVIFPKNNFAEINIEPSSAKIVRLTEDENAQGIRGVEAMSAFYYFIGSPKEIYQSFLNVRMAEGHRVYPPKSAWFGVGWEAFGALAWNTNQQTVKENVERYLSHGYPLTWMVVGSGFWPRGVGEFDEHGTPYSSESASEAAKKLQATTSFGMWDGQLYPNPKEFIDHFHQQGLIFTIGLRIGFIPGGPYTDEGLQQDYFISDENGDPKTFQIGFPRVPIYLLDAHNPAAAAWYDGLCKKWEDYGVDGFKEDLFGWPEELPDDLIDPVNRRLMDRGVYIMGRNNYVGSPADIHRFDDFNYNQNQDRGPINGLAYAFSGFPNVYPDIIGGTGLATGRFGDEPRENLRIYLIRYAQYAALNPSMAFGFGPWNFDEETNRLCLEAAQLHDRLVPYIFSHAIKAYETGYPYPMTPLPIAYPHDPNVYGLADTSRRNYQWLIGESLLAAPLYGDDYTTANTRNIYLPAGKWMDYTTGEIFEGPRELVDFPIPIDKIPLFVGGPGFVVEQNKETLLGRLYPLSQQAEVNFYALDGTTKSVIHIDVENWEQLKIEDDAGQEIDYEKVRFAYQFTLIPGKNYFIK